MSSRRRISRHENGQSLPWSPPNPAAATIARSQAAAPWSALVGSVAIILGAVGCSSSDQPGELENPDASTGTCVDNDGDGYGVNCPRGPDCDDTDPNVTIQCLQCHDGVHGCPCTSKGASAECGKLTTRNGDYLTCQMGYSTCDGTAWGTCVGNTTIHVARSNPGQS